MQNINIAFQLSTIRIKADNILSSKSILKSTIYTKKYGQIKASFRIIPNMIGMPTTNQQIADITAYLNRHKK